jgi:MYXO-CTERM domain-containing protein
MLGLADDLEDQQATMYIRTLPGDTRKRSPLPEEESVLTRLYSESSKQQAGAAGCSVVSGRSSEPTRLLVGLLVGVLGLARRRVPKKRRELRAV